MDKPVGIIMGSQSDWPTMKEAATILDELGVGYEARIVSAHRTPDRLWDYGKTAVERGLRVLIAGAGGAAEAEVKLAWLDHAVRLNLVFSISPGRWARMGGLGQTNRFE